MPPPEVLVRMLPPELANRMPGPTADFFTRHPGPGMMGPGMVGPGMVPPMGPGMVPPMGPGMVPPMPMPPLEMMQTDSLPNGTVLDPEKEEKQKTIRLFQAGI